MIAAQLKFLADAAEALDGVRERNDETKSFLYLGKCEVKCEGVLVGYLEDPEALGYSYEPTES